MSSIRQANHHHVKPAGDSAGQPLNRVFERYRFKSLHEALDTTTPGGRLVFHVFAALAEFIRELIVEGTRDGLDAARARGVRLGRSPAMTAEQIRHARDLLTRPDNTVSSIARLLGVSRATIYKYVPEVTERQSSALPPGQKDAI